MRSLLAPGVRANREGGCGSVSVASRTKGKERRRWDRLPLCVPVFVRGQAAGGKKFLEFTNAFNISCGGACLAVSHYLPLSARISLEIPSVPLPRRLAPPQPRGTLSARVVRVRHAGPWHLCSVKWKHKQERTGGRQSPRARERRRWDRFPLPIAVFVRGVDDQGREFLEFTNAFNFNAGGALLAIRRHLPRSFRLCLEIPSAPIPPVRGLPRFVEMLGARVIAVSPSNGYDLCSVQLRRPLL